MKIRDVNILIVPGDDNPGPDHWLRRWAAKMATARLLGSAATGRDQWVAELRQAICAATRPVVLVAHAIGVAACVQAVHGQEGIKAAARIKGGFFVAPPDLSNTGNGTGYTSIFGPYPTDPLPFPSFVIASRTDPASSLEKTAEMAADWGAHLVDAGDAGQIDTKSGHGPWPEGLMVFAGFMKRL